MGRQRLFIFDLEEKVMLITAEEKRKIRRNLLKIGEAMTEIERILIDATILGVPDLEEDPEEKEIPSEDVTGVRHGRWCGEADGYADGELVYDMWSCPVCGERFYEWDEEPTWAFCPKCGTDMRGE